jgi:REP element-mobilizing transposase RayT
MTSGAAFVAMDRLLDSEAAGPTYLRRPEIANLVAEAICCRDREGGHYRLHAWVVMSNHVHVLVTPRVPVSTLMQSLKRFTAREANRVLNRTGQVFWQDESYDHLVRDGAEFGRIVSYIEMNPVRAGLVSMPEEFFWSSAWPIHNRPAGWQPAPQGGV